MKVFFRKIHIIFISIITLLSLFFSCEDVINVQLDQAPEQLVIDGQINDHETIQTIKLSLTLPYFQNNSIPQATGATVTVLDNQNNNILFQEKSPGVYQADNFMGKPGNTYTLTINYQGDTYYAVSTMPPQIVVDSIKYESTTNTRNDNDKYYRFYLYAKEPRGEPRYYKSKAFINGQDQEQAQDIFVTLKDDQLVDGNYINKEQIFRTNKLRSNDLVKIEFRAIESKAHFFYLQAALQSRGGLFNPPPSNINGNIVNANPNGKKALGLFIATSINVFKGAITNDQGNLIKE
jgi:hypothetical protein